MNVLEQVQQSCRELGLPIPGSLVATGDQTAIQMFGLWNALGQELYEQYRWKELQGTHVFQTQDNVATYPVPADFAGPIDNTEWSRTNHWQMIGQMTPQQWETLKSGIVALGPRVRYRFIDNSIEIFPTPAPLGTGASFAPETLAYEYYRNGWVKKANGITTTIATEDTDSTFFNERMMINGTKLKFWQIKGFDTKTLQADFERIFNQAMSRNQGAPRLSLSPRLSPIYIGPWNVSDGSWVTG